MEKSFKHPSSNGVHLTHEIATKYLEDLTAIANQIPEVSYCAEDILSNLKGDRQLLNKWDHSLVIFDDNKPIALAIGYERHAERNVQYPNNTIYISELAVADTHQHQGIGRFLLSQFFKLNDEIGFISLSGELEYSVQTNLAEWNSHVIDLYKSFGFKQRATKVYPNRLDVVLGLSAESLKLE